MPLSQIHRPLLGPLLVAVLAVVCAMPATGRERPSTAPAARFLQATIDAALPLAIPPVNEAGDARLRGILNAALDFPNLTIFALGHYVPTWTMPRTPGRRLRSAINYAPSPMAGAAYPTLALTVTGLRVDADGNRRVQSVARLPRVGAVEVESISKMDGPSYRVVDIQSFGLTLRHFLRDWVTVLVAGQDPATVFGPPGAASPQ